MVIEYIKYTGKNDILQEVTNYVKGQTLEDNVDERYDLYPPSEEKESILKHCIRAIDKSLNFGENGLPKIGSGDWNDGFSTVGNKGKGESVWLGFFQYTVIKGFIPILEMVKNNLIQEINNIKLKEFLNTNYTEVIENVLNNGIENKVQNTENSNTDDKHNVLSNISNNKALYNNNILETNNNKNNVEEITNNVIDLQKDSKVNLVKELEINPDDYELVLKIKQINDGFSMTNMITNKCLTIENRLFEQATPTTARTISTCSATNVTTTAP